MTAPVDSQNAVKRPRRLPAWVQQHAELSEYPNMAFEAFYQHGLECFKARLPRWLVRQSFAALVSRHPQVALWQVRAFLWGLKGGANPDEHTRVSAHASWPEKLPGWDLVICRYPNGELDIDLVHPVSRRFWSEDNHFLPVPEGLAIDQAWLTCHGFEIMPMMPVAQLSYDRRPAHLTLVSKDFPQ